MSVESRCEALNVLTELKL